MQESPVCIWPPCHAFYILSMLAICDSAENSYIAVVKSLQAKTDRLSDREILDNIQNIVQQAANLSRYFWPTNSKDKNKQKIFQDRGQFLRTSLNVSDDSPLKDRKLRNLIEHFDENLDLYLCKPIAGHIIPEYVGNEPSNREIPTHYFRAYFLESAVFEALGNRYEIEPITIELERLHTTLIRLNDENRGFLG